MEGPTPQLATKRSLVPDVFFFQAEDGIRDLVRSRGLGDVYKRQSVVNGDGDVVTDSFKDGVIHAVLVEVLAFKKAAGMVMFNEKADAEGVMKAVYNNPLEMWRNKTIEFLYLARVARRIQAIPTKQD